MPDGKLQTPDNRPVPDSGTAAPLVRTRGLAFQRGVYRFCRAVIGPAVCRFFRFRYTPCRIQSPTFLALGNHTQNLDPALLVMGTGRHMRFVANASLTKGAAGLVLNNLFGLIPREKGAKGDAAVALIEANLRAGISVGMFPEGNRSWDGETEFISRRTARLAKNSGAALVTYRFTGGYLLRPRWAYTRRRGPMYGELVREYTPDELARMTEDQVYEAICRDLYVDAYQSQAARGDRYPGKRLAEGLEYAAYLCPACHRFGTLHTREDELWCDCGLRARYTDTGRFASAFPFEHFGQWNRFQKQWTHEHAEELRRQTDRPIAEDHGFRLTLVEQGQAVPLSRNASIALYGDRLTLTWENNGETKSPGKTNFPGEITYRIEQITGFGTFLSRSMYFNCGATRYQLIARETVSTLKYYALWRALSGREYL